MSAEGGHPIRSCWSTTHPLLLDGLTLALEVAGMEVVGTATSVAAAVEVARARQPDVVVMDVQLPDGNGGRGHPSRRDGGAGDRGAHPFPELTDREREVLSLVAKGLPNSSIARDPNMSPKTAANHFSTILMKLQVTHRTEAALLAREAGL